MAAFTNYDMFVTDIYYLSVNVRDTLTYTQEKFNNSVEAFRDRKKRILNGMQEGSPFSHFCNNNKESGQKIVNILNNFLDDVYSDESTILRIVDGVIVPDNAQFVKILEYVVGIHETLSDIYNGYAKHGTTSGNPVNPVVIELFAAGEQFYRSYVHICLVSQLIDLFKSFNNAMNESKGQKNENTNFWNGEINRVVTFIKFVEEKTVNPDVGTQMIYDKIKETVRFMQGEVPVPEGKTLWTEFDESRKLASTYFAKVFPIWQAKSSEVVKLGTEYLEASQKQNNNRVKDDA